MSAEHHIAASKIYHLLAQGCDKERAIAQAKFLIESHGYSEAYADKVAREMYEVVH